MIFAGQEGALPSIRKTLADMFDDSMLTSVPPKVVYSGRAISSNDSLGRALSETSVDAVPCLRYRSRHATMLAHMKEVETAAIKDQPTALHLLVMKGQTKSRGPGHDCVEAQAPSQTREHHEQTSEFSPDLSGSLGSRCNNA